MTEGGDRMKLEYWFEDYSLLFDKSIFILFNKISKYLFISFGYFVNLLVNPVNIFLVSKILRECVITSFKLGIDLTVIDFYYKNIRFKILYILLNLYNNNKICISTTPFNNMLISSVSSLYKSFN
jgi:NADH:ubiquinone oxidoreductase subunit C